MTETSTEHRTIDSEPATPWLRRVGRSNLLVFLAWFALILVLKWPTLTQPPVWDGSMSVFPAAITLAENGFDPGYLLDQPGYADGGPNVHSLSLVTWLTATVIALVGDGPALFPVLHLIHFSIAAAAMVAILRFARPVLGPWLGVVTALTILLFPLVLTQAGYLYLEFPMLAITAFAALAWTRGNLPLSIFWSAAAVLIKGPGIIVPIALAGMAFFDPRPGHRNPRSGLLILVAPAIILAFSVMSIPGLVNGANIRDHLVIMFQYLTRVPDLLILLLAYLGATLLFAPFRRARTIGETMEPRTTEARSHLLLVAFVVAAFFGFYILLPVLGIAAPVLPRYYVQVLPFALVGLLGALRGVLSDRLLAALLVMMVVWFGVNRNGDFYPDNTINNFALIERSGAYTDLLALQQKGIRSIVALPDEVPVFYDQPAHYKLSYPLMGYSQGPLREGHSILHEAPYREGNIVDFPDEFYMLHEYSWLGGELIRSIWEQALDDPGRIVAVDTICSSAYCSGLIHVMRAPAS